jgi:hypothetical protein
MDAETIVTCVDNFDGQLALTLGKDYVALWRHETVYWLAGDDGVEQTYETRLFEVKFL